MSPHKFTQPVLPLAPQLSLCLTLLTLTPVSLQASLHMAQVILLATYLRDPNDTKPSSKYM